MKKVTILLFTFILFSLISCKNSEKAWSELPKETNISSLKQTAFAPTLESQVSPGKNIIYAPALLYAWEKIEQKFKQPIVVNAANSKDFILLNQSTSYKNSLNGNEHSADAEVVDGAIVARAFFNKTLPFPTRLQKLDNVLTFDKEKVAAFGMRYFDEEAIKFTEILYYKNDNNFVLKLMPKDNGHEILLTKGVAEFTSLAEGVKAAERLIALGGKEKSEPKQYWKYSFNPEDIFYVPSLKFNIATNYKELEGQVFKSGGKEHFIETAYQRTGFILNENGAVVESEVMAVVDSVAAPSPEIHPKRMIFDKPFLIIVKHTNSKNPYFVMKVATSELMVKE